MSTFLLIPIAVILAIAAAFIGHDLAEINRVRNK